MVRERRSARSRFTWGVLLLVFGAFALAFNLGVRIPRDLWEYWPLILIALGVVQLIWPGPGRERLRGVWLLAVGVYAWVSTFEVFGLDWGTAVPILVVIMGVRILLGALLSERHEETPSAGSQNDQRGAS